MNLCDNPIIIYLVPHFRHVLDNFRCYGILGLIRLQKTPSWQYMYFTAENSLIIDVITPIAIAMDLEPVSYLPIVG